MNALRIGIMIIAIWGALAFAEEKKGKHEHGEETKSQAKNKGHADEAEEKGHQHEDGEEEEEEHGHKHAEGKEEEEHGEEDEGEASSVGPEKGIVAKSKEGLKLSVEAEKVYDLKAVVIGTNGIFRIPEEAVVYVKSEKSFFRVRDGWYKRLPLHQVDKLRSGDKIVTSGTGFLRIAEIAAEGGASHGHSH